MKSTLIPVCFLIMSAACGGGGDDAITVVDAAIDAPVDAAIDAAIDGPPVCNAPSMVCGGVCTDVTQSEQYCGDCNTACTGGKVCNAGNCACAQDITIPPNPTWGFSLVNDTQVPGVTLGVGVLGALTTDALLVGRTTSDTMVGTPHTLSGGSVGTPPFVAYGYDVSLATMTASAAYYATEGTLTFTKICLTGAGQMAGFSATLEGAAFSAVDSLTNPVLVPGGCRYPMTGTLGTITLTYGNVTCP